MGYLTVGTISFVSSVVPSPEEPVSATPGMPSVLLVGRSLRRSGFTSTSWQDLPSALAFDDFDSVVLDLSTLGEHSAATLLNDRADQIHRLLGAQKAVRNPGIVLIGWNPELKGILPYWPEFVDGPFSNLDVTPTTPDLIRLWMKNVNAVGCAASTARTALNGKYFEIDPYVGTKTALTVAGRIEDCGARLHPITFLPVDVSHPVPADDDVVGLINEHFGLSGTTPRPDWIETVVGPRTLLTAKADVVERQSALETATSRLKEAIR